VTFTLFAIVVATVIAVLAITGKAGETMPFLVLPPSVLALLVPLALYRWRLTPAGVDAVASWRRDGYEALRTPGGQGPGTGQAGTGHTGTGRTEAGRTVWALDGPQAAALPTGHAWSSFGGQWHTVKLGRLLPKPYWSLFPGFRIVLVFTVLASVYSNLTGGLVMHFNANGKLIAFGPAVVGAAVLLILWLPFFARRMAMPGKAQYLGEIVRLLHIEGGSETPEQYLAWVDDGSPTSRQWEVSRDVYYRLSVADPVQVTWSPRRASVIDIVPAGR
jgi:hypothetical protein